MHGAGEILRVGQGCDGGFGYAQLSGERQFRGVSQQRGIDGAVVRAVLLVLDAQDVRGAAGAGQQVLPLGAAEEGGDGVGSGQQSHQVVVGPCGEDSGQHVMPGALGTELDAEAVCDEVEQFADCFCGGARQFDRQIGRNLTAVLTIPHYLSVSAAPVFNSGFKKTAQSEPQTVFSDNPD